MLMRSLKVWLVVVRMTWPRVFFVYWVSALCIPSASYWDVFDSAVHSRFSSGVQKTSAFMTYLCHLIFKS